MLQPRPTAPITELEASQPADLQPAHAASRLTPNHGSAAPIAARPPTNGSPSASAAPVAPVAPAAPPAVESHFWLTRPDQLLLAGLIAVALGLLAVHWMRLAGWQGRPVEIDRLPPQAYEFRVDVNRATWIEWTQLDGIGDGLARRIVEDRRQNGPFRSIDDLQRVKGIGPKTVERLRPWLRIDPRG
jgi:competence protein ComEA